MVAGVLLLVFLVLVHVGTGTANISIADVINVLTGQHVDNVTYTIVYELRLPRALVAVAAGGMLALAGAIMQAVTRNRWPTLILLEQPRAPSSLRCCGCLASCSTGVLHLQTPAYRRLLWSAA